MTIHVPKAEDLRVVPDLAILSALEASLEITLEVIFASNPQLTNRSLREHENLSPILRTADTLATQAASLIVTINRYRLNLVDF
jgi:hypothetical protein